VKNRYYDGNRLARVVKGRWAQFGINGDPAVRKPGGIGRLRTIHAGNPTCAAPWRLLFAVPNGSTTQVYINTGDNSARNDGEAFSPFAKVVEGMDVVDALYSDYGETSGGGIRAGKAGADFRGWQLWLDPQFPRAGPDRASRSIAVTGRAYNSIFVPSTVRNCAIQAGCAGHAGAVTRLPSV